MTLPPFLRSGIVRSSIAALAVITLASCSLTQKAEPSVGASSVAATPSATSAAPSPSDDQSTAAEEPTAADETSSAEETSAAATLTACQALTKSELNAALGTTYLQGRNNKISELISQCEYNQADGGGGAISQIIAANAYTEYVAEMKKQLGTGTSSTPATVAGADKANVLVGKVKGNPAVSIIVSFDGKVAQVLVLRTNGKLPSSAQMVKSAEALLA